jgi:hypothetical protein
VVPAAFAVVSTPVTRRVDVRQAAGRCGVVVEILAYYARGRGFDSRTVQTFVLGLGVSMYKMYVFTKKYI